MFLNVSIVLFYYLLGMCIIFLLNGVIDGQELNQNTA